MMVCGPKEKCLLYFVHLFIRLYTVAHGLKVSRTPGPTACSRMLTERFRMKSNEIECDGQEFAVMVAKVLIMMTLVKLLLVKMG